ncbi:hypothetical protein BDV27DRAFT_153804 [Aspergillus caelatus]|uniref:Uncharacterized protein n=2 Tax=Aspergillus subgen. Circumdati TaxID=2720871 RepID=A0A5N7AFW4_9EURO|nr:uncharacterized protein BDV27DRAFT_153804 [Aspergillus caelatus]KAE8368605.1 hypothetical protein BDV27DRAFT_153804 [Aspergillus caelatus]KAE8418451.1 hypothetical protein BDV36DRAFT_295095 [Aspergillus pseudocaelatus]
MRATTYISLLMLVLGATTAFPTGSAVADADDLVRNSWSEKRSEDADDFVRNSWSEKRSSQ